MKDLSHPSGAVSQETKELIQKSVSANTKRAYRTSLRQLEEWLGARSITDALLADYITELHHTGRSPSTIAQVLAAIKWRYPQVELIGEITERTMAGIRTEGIERGRGQVKGLDYAEVDRVIAFCEAEKTVKGLRDAALIRLMSDCLLRVSEVVAVNIGDINVRDQTLTVRKSKTDQTGEGATLFMCDDTIVLIGRYVTAGEIHEGAALFRRMTNGDKLNQHRLTDRSARRIITDRAHSAGIEGFISGHSLRVGAAESLAQAGVSLVELQDAGRWKDPKMPAHYARHQIASRGAVARIRNRQKGQ